MDFHAAGEKQMMSDRTSNNVAQLYALPISFCGLYI